MLYADAGPELPRKAQELNCAGFSSGWFARSQGGLGFGDERVDRGAWPTIESRSQLIDAAASFDGAGCARADQRPVREDPASALQAEPTEACEDAVERGQRTVDVGVFREQERVSGLSIWIRLPTNRMIGAVASDARSKSALAARRSFRYSSRAS